MVSVRQRRIVALALGALASSACNRDKGPPPDTTTVIEEAPAPVEKPIVMPTWSTDTSTFAVDRVSAIRPALRARVKRCTETIPTVSADSIGPLYPGQSLERVIRACPRATTVFHFDDGRYGPAVAVLLGKALVIADLDGTAADAQVTRVAAFDRAKTAEGIGPGSPLANVRREYGAPRWRRYQCSVDAIFDTKGLVVRIALPEEGSDAVTCNDLRRLAEGPDFSNFPRGSRVAWIATELAGVR